MFLVFPQDSGAALGRDDGVDGIFLHQDAVSHGDAQRAAAAALSDNTHDHGDFEAGHFAKIVGNGFRLAALFGSNPGIGARSIHKAENGPGKLIGKLHGADGLAISLGLSAPEIPELPLFEIASFLMSHNHDRSAVENSHSCYNCRIVAKTAVAVDFRKALKKPLDIIHRIGTRIMARQESSFIRQTFIVFAEPFHFCPQMIKLVL